MNTPTMRIEPFELGEGDWRTLDDIPPIVRRFLSLYALSLTDNVDGRTPAPDFDELMEVYDDLDGQPCIAAKNEEGRIVGVASYDLDRPSGAFLEGVAVAPEARRGGVALRLFEHAFEAVRAAGHSTVMARSQPSALAANQATIDRLGYSYTVSNERHPKLDIRLT